MQPAAAARLMLQMLVEDGFLYQESAAMKLAEFDDEGLAYYDASGNLCVGKKVLAEFNKLTPDIVYERSGKFWRHRLDTDQSGRQQ